MIATAPGKLIVSGEYAVLDGAPALVLAIDRRAVARLTTRAQGSSPFLLAVATELANRRGANHPAARAALAIAVDSSAFYDGATKLGLGSSAAVTVAAAARALGETGAPLDTGEVLAIAMAAHATAQGARGARGSGADIASAVHGGVIAFTAGSVERLRWPASVTLLPFFTGIAADTATLVARIATARAAQPAAIEAALTAIGDASRAACAACAAPPDLAAPALISALALAGTAVDRLGTAAGVALVPSCVSAARSAMSRFGGTAKTTGAGGGDVGVAVIPSTADVPEATRALIEAGCRPLPLSVDNAGVDLRSDAS
jgi:phosphomevalonate kinase